MILQCSTRTLSARCKPRASGDDPEFPWADADGRPVNPARAGMIRIRGRPPRQADRKPRASGDDPEQTLAMWGGFK